jgi:hypothetical protein
MSNRLLTCFDFAVYNHHRAWDTNDKGGVWTADMTQILGDWFNPYDHDWGAVHEYLERHVATPIRINHYGFRSLQDCIFRQKGNWDGQNWRHNFAWMCYATLVFV